MEKAEEEDPKGSPVTLTAVKDKNRKVNQRKPGKIRKIINLMNTIEMLNSFA